MNKEDIEKLSEKERIDAIAERYREILLLLGEDSMREGLVKTPMRAAKAMWYCAEGYRQNPEEIMEQALFAHDGSRMVVVKDIEFYSMCEHHILPFFGLVSIGYIPNGKIVGLSKVARVVNSFARRLQVQERMTAQICQAIESVTGAKGVIVQCTAGHMCMKMRGVEKQESQTSTIEYCGEFEANPALREEFFRQLK